MNLKDSESNLGEVTKHHFDVVASHYSEVRKPSNTVIDIIATMGELQDTSVVDLGCGPGQTLAYLKENYNVKGFGIDLSFQMAKNASERIPVVNGQTETLPFQSASFDRAISTMAVHLFDRQKAFPEIFRILKPGGKFIMTSVDTEKVEEVWLQAYFPSYGRVEKLRLPPLTALKEELFASGFTEISFMTYVLSNTLTKEAALDKIRRRAYSSFNLLSEDEYLAGLEAAEQDMPEQITATLPMIFLFAS